MEKKTGCYRLEVLVAINLLFSILFIPSVSTHLLQVINNNCQHILIRKHNGCNYVPYENVMLTAVLL